MKLCKMWNFLLFNNIKIPWVILKLRRYLEELLGKIWRDLGESFSILWKHIFYQMFVKKEKKKAYFDSIESSAAWESLSSESPLSTFSGSNIKRNFH